jgi:hypothetical protein
LEQTGWSALPIPVNRSASRPGLCASSHRLKAAVNAKNRTRKTHPATQPTVPAGRLRVTARRSSSLLSFAEMLTSTCPSIHCQSQSRNTNKILRNSTIGRSQSNDCRSMPGMSERAICTCPPDPESRDRIFLPFSHPLPPLYLPFTPPPDPHSDLTDVRCFGTILPEGE